MKKTIFTLVLSAILSFSFAQKTVINSIADGLWLMPTTWDCACIPGPGDIVNISNNVTLNTSWSVVGGTITINPSGSLVKDNTVRTLALNTGTLMNKGTFVIDQVANYSGTVVNTGHMNVIRAFLNNDTLKNSGTFDNIDSLQNNHYLVNTSTGTLSADNLWNNYNMNNAGRLDLTYFLTTRYFINNGYLQANKFLNTDSCTINDSVKVMIDFMNAGYFKLSNSVYFDVTNNFLNGDSVFHDAMFINNGQVLIGNDFTNLDSIKGNLGYFCIVSYSANHGYIGGTVDICDQSPLTGPPYIDYNTGTIATTVSSCTLHACNVGINETAGTNSAVDVYPNPFNDLLTFEFKGTSTPNSILSVFDVLGQRVFTNTYNTNKITIERNNLKNGVYFYRLQTNAGVVTGKLIAE